MVKCGAQPVFYEYPAWTFGGKRGAEQVPPGPGTGGIGAKPTLGGTGFVYGPRSPAVARSEQPFGDGIHTGEKYLKPGYLSKEPAAPAYTFGNKYPGSLSRNPGPDAYETINSRRSTMRSAPTTSWGPPPRAVRPASAPRRPVEDRPPAKAKGPTFGTSWCNLTKQPSPGPQDYQCNCGNGCCRYCDSYNGGTIKGRRPLLYGKVTTVTPGPAAYHTECSTIGVATTSCPSGMQKGAPRMHRH